MPVAMDARFGLAEIAVQIQQPIFSNQASDLPIAHRDGQDFVVGDDAERDRFFIRHGEEAFAVNLLVVIHRENVGIVHRPLGRGHE